MRAVGGLLVIAGVSVRDVRPPYDGSTYAIHCLADHAAPRLAASGARAGGRADLHPVLGTRLGPEIRLHAYTPAHDGDWRANYRRWTPVTLYDVNGHYYRTAVNGSRPVNMYSYNGEYFTPPSDQAWVGIDRRFNYDRRPGPDDISRAPPFDPSMRVDARFGPELGVFEFSPQRAGDWRANYRRWSPVTVYESNGHYYSRRGPGARPVTIYRYRDEYFLPPQDRAWGGFDRRFDYSHAPTDQDHRWVHALP